MLKWINRFNQCGVEGLIVKKRPGRMTIINDQQASQLNPALRLTPVPASVGTKLDVINHPKKTQKTACIGTLL